MKHAPVDSLCSLSGLFQCTNRTQFQATTECRIVLEMVAEYHQKMSEITLQLYPFQATMELY